MNRDIHDIYDVILKIIATVYGTVFLKYIGIEKDIEEILNIELTTITGSKLYLDFLCRLNDDTLCHIEFQFPKADLTDANRFFNYNITAQVRYQKLTETTIINFTQQKINDKPVKIGETKCFYPNQVYLGDLDFKKYLENIKIKVKSNKQLSHFDEITLMLMSIIPEFENKFEMLKKISNLFKNENLYNEEKLEFIQAIIKLEIENLLTAEEQKEIKEDIKMSPHAESIIKQAINEVNWKVLAETEEKGIEKGKKDTMKSVAKQFKNQIDIQELSKFTGISIEEIEKL